MPLMCYDAGYEKKFREMIKSTRSSINRGEYSEASSELADAQELTDKLWLPSTLEEKVKYLKLTRQNYKTISDLYKELVEKLTHDYEELENRENDADTIKQNYDELKEKNEELETNLKEANEELDRHKQIPHIDNIESLLFDV